MSEELSWPRSVSVKDQTAKGNGFEIHHFYVICQVVSSGQKLLWSEYVQNPQAEVNFPLISIKGGAIRRG